MRIAIIGKFQKIYDEEYIARSFEMLGHMVSRYPDNCSTRYLFQKLEEEPVEMVLFTKYEHPECKEFIKALKKREIKTVCWLFDLYFGYPREYRVAVAPYFKAEYVFTTDGGHQHDFLKLGINHQVVRQGIYKEECYAKNEPKEYEVVFVGSDNPLYQDRAQIMKFVGQHFDLTWFGRKNTDEIRSHDLNTLYGKTQIVVGDSVYSPYYWSNRVVETLGRGGFLIHPEVEGIKEEFHYLVTYERKNLNDLKGKIEYYLSHDKEREELVKRNLNFVMNNYTMDKKCAELIQKL